ncbi:hypothetical protein J6590_040208 [Homalodisca vitripennis]|nr:hypothetical protein J6590_040208 [Homalodisca vitripennis]
MTMDVSERCHQLLIELICSSLPEIIAISFRVVTHPQPQVVVTSGTAAAGGATRRVVMSYHRIWIVYPVVRQLSPNLLLLSLPGNRAHCVLDFISIPDNRGRSYDRLRGHCGAARRSVRVIDAGGSEGLTFVGIRGRLQVPSVSFCKLTGRYAITSPVTGLMDDVVRHICGINNNFWYRFVTECTQNEFNQHHVTTFNHRSYEVDVGDARRLNMNRPSVTALLSLTNTEKSFAALTSFTGRIRRREVTLQDIEEHNLNNLNISIDSYKEKWMERYAFSVCQSCTTGQIPSALSFKIESVGRSKYLQHRSKCVSFDLDGRSFSHVLTDTTVGQHPTSTVLTNKSILDSGSPRLGEWRHKTRLLRQTGEVSPLIIATSWKPTACSRPAPRLAEEGVCGGLFHLALKGWKEIFIRVPSPSAVIILLYRLIFQRYKIDRPAIELLYSTLGYESRQCADSLCWQISSLMYRADSYIVLCLKFVFDYGNGIFEIVKETGFSGHLPSFN